MNLKKLILIVAFTLLTLLFCGLSVSAETYSGSCGDGLTYTLDSNGELTITGTGAMTNWSEPSLVPWYDKKDDIIYVTLENGVSSIGNNAFSGCSNLEDIVIEGNVTSIGDNAFSDCGSLSIVEYVGTPEDWEAITIGIGNEQLISVKEKYFFIAQGECGEEAWWVLSSEGLLIVGGSGDMADWSEGNPTPWNDKKYIITKILFVGEITSIGDNAFTSCENLIYADLPYGISSIGANAFSECNNLVDILIRNSVTKIAKGAFAGCNKLHDVNYYGTHEQWNNIKIETDNESLINAVLHCHLADGECGDNVWWTLIDDGTLMIGGNGDMWDWSEKSFVPWNEYSSDIKNIIIENNVNSIGNNSFTNCNNLTNVEIRDSVTSIGQKAFFGCNNLIHIVLYDSVTDVGESAFSGCSSLYDIDYYGTSRVWNTITIGTDNKALTNAVLHCHICEIENVVYSEGGVLISMKVYEDIELVRTYILAVYGESNQLLGFKAVTPDSPITSLDETVEVSCKPKYCKVMAINSFEKLEPISNPDKKDIA